MKALTFQGKKELKFESLDDPEIKEGTDVIVKVQLAGISEEDLHIYRGDTHSPDVGTVMGHEFVGEVIEEGFEVNKFSRGDKVFAPFSTSCGSCYFCKKGLTSNCDKGQFYGSVKKGVGLHGSQSEFIRVPLADNSLMPFPSDVSDEEALLLGNTFSTGYYSATRAEITKEGTNVVIGCGQVGMMAILATRELGGEVIYAIDSVPERLQLAKIYGAIPINYKEENPLEVIEALTEGRGATSIMETVGDAKAVKLAFDLVRFGGTISSVGIHNNEQFPFTPAQAFKKNLTYRIGRTPALAYIKKLLPIVKSKKYDLDSIITHKVSLENGTDVYKQLDKREDGCIKAVLIP